MVDLSNVIFKTAKEEGVKNNKNVNIKKIIGIYIDNFRGLENQEFLLANNITVVSGRNGSMKSTIMGLVAHPFSTAEIDIMGNSIKTNLSEVFSFSKIHDVNKYNYFIKLEAEYASQNLYLSEPISISYRKTENRHRIIVSGQSKGNGNFNFPSRYINLKRLYPLTESRKNEEKKVIYNDAERKFISKFFERVLLKGNYSNFSTFSANASAGGNITSTPIGPVDSDYDIESISSGEHNLGTIVNTLISFMRIYNKLDDNNKKNKESFIGLLSIDEFEASLHPISQLNLFDFLLSWSKKYKVQIIINTHSLYLIEEIINKEKEIKNKEISLNFITYRYSDKLKILHNPDYRIAKEELTLKVDEYSKTLSKIKLLCEDEVAKGYIKKIIGRNLSKYCVFQYDLVPDNSGSPYKGLLSLAKNGAVLLKDTMSLIIVDGDVADTEIESAKRRFDYILSIPTVNSKLPIEKDLIVYILKKSRSDDFFEKTGKTKDVFIQEFSSFEIPLNHSQANSYSIDCYKKWFSHQSKTDLNKYLKYMIKDNNEIFKKFKEDLTDIIENIFRENGFPFQR